MSETAPTLMSPDTALEHLLTKAPTTGPAQDVPVQAALGRVLASPVKAAVTVPPTDNSAVDGYAIRHEDYTPGHSLPVVQRVAAGQDPGPLAPGTAARIFTGAAIPAGADTVLMQENCTMDDSNNQVSINKEPDKGQNIRPAGQDINAGDDLLTAGTRLLPQHMGLLASVGLATVPVYPRLRVAILSTGDELVAPGQPLQPGQIYNSNRFTLQGMLQAMGCEVLDLGDIADTMDDTLNALRRGAEGADVIVSSGGVSVGEADYVRDAVKTLGHLDLWRLAIKPGKPFAFGAVGETPFIGLPGNPAAVLVTFLILAKPFLRHCQGLPAHCQHPPVRARIDFAIDSAGKRRDFQRVRCRMTGGELWLESAANQSSGRLSSACWADGLAVIPEHQTLTVGDTVDYLPFDQLVYG